MAQQLHTRIVFPRQFYPKSSLGMKLYILLCTITGRERLIRLIQSFFEIFARFPSFHAKNARFIQTLLIQFHQFEGNLTGA